MPNFLHLLPFVFFFISCTTHESKEFHDFKGNTIPFQEFSNFIDSTMGSLEIPGISLAMINDSKVVFHTARGVKNRITQEAVDQNTIFEAASLSKPMFSYFTLKLMEKGVIDLYRPLYFYKAEADLAIDPRYKNVTAQQVLSHQSGFPNWRWFSPIPDSITIERGDFFMLQNPGSGFTYSGEAYQYLARVLAHNLFSNMHDLADVFEAEISIPLDLDHVYFVWDDFLYENKAFGHQGERIKREWGSGLPHQTSQNFNAAGGLHTEAKSYAKFLTTLIKREGLYPSTFDLFFAPQTQLPEGHSYVESDPISDWCLGIAKARAMGRPIYRHGGSNSDFQSEFVIDLEQGFGYVFFVNCPKGKEFKVVLEQFLGLRN